MITPQTMTNLFNQDNIAIVNTLSNDYHINTNPINLKNNYGKNFIDKMTTKKLKEFNLIVLYCANYTCSAAKKYYKKLTEKFKDLEEKLVFMKVEFLNGVIYHLIILLNLL